MNVMKECVICGNVYLTEVDWAGRERLVPAELDPIQTDISGTSSMSTSRGKVKAREEITPVRSIIYKTFMTLIIKLRYREIICLYRMQIL
jgi:hypothetical protein